MTDARPVLDQVNLVVHDMEATLRFYRRLGLDIPEDAVWRTGSGAHHVTVTMPNGVDLEFDSVELAKEYNAGWRAPGTGGSRGVIGFSWRPGTPWTRPMPSWRLRVTRVASPRTTRSGDPATRSSKIRKGTTSAS